MVSEELHKHFSRFNTAWLHSMCTALDLVEELQEVIYIQNKIMGMMGRRMYWELTKANIPLVGCRANEIENLLTAEPRVASEKEKHRYLKCITANRKRA